MPTNAEHTYDLSPVLELPGTSSIRPGTSILVSGPSMTGKDRLVLQSLATGTEHGEAAVVVTTERAGEDTLTDIESFASDIDRSQLAAIDCRSGSGRDERELDGGAFVYSVSDPSDLTGIGIGITRSFDRMRGRGLSAGRTAVTSLSTMIRYSDRKTVFKFCHVLSQRLDSTEFLGFFTLNSGAHDDQTIQVIKQAFDANIEIRETDGDRQARVRGLDAGSSEWTTIE